MLPATPPSSARSERTVRPSSTNSCCNLSYGKVAQWAILFFSIVALITLYALGKGYTDYTPIAYVTGGGSILPFIFRAIQSCTTSKDASSADSAIADVAAGRCPRRRRRVEDPTQVPPRKRLVQQPIVRKPEERRPIDVFVNVEGKSVKLDNVMQVRDDGVHVALGDGNCLFHSALASLKALGKADDIRGHLALREHVVNWIAEKAKIAPGKPDYDDVLESNVIESMKEHFAAKLRRAIESDVDPSIANQLNHIQTDAIEKNQLEISHLDKICQDLENGLSLGKFTKELNEYLQDMIKDRTHGTGTEVYALSRIFNVCIEVATPDKMIKYGENLAANGTLHLILERGHYNFKLPTRL